MGIVFWSLVGLALERPARMNVVLITIDTLRADRLSAYGYAKHVTPNIDRLAREGTLFEHAFCDVTWTTPSMASVMTGVYATRHGLRSSFQTLTPSATTLAEILVGAGYDTAAIIASFPLHSMFGLNQGFRLYDEHFDTPLAVDPALAFGPQEPLAVPAEPPAAGDVRERRWFLMAKALSEGYRPDSAVSDRAIAWLRNERRDPFFLWVHYFGPHEKPTGLPISEEIPKQVEAYDPDVVLTDTQVGRLLDEIDRLGLTARTAVVLHADHGQSLLEHGHFGHGRFVFEPSQHIPLIIRAPGRVPANHRVSTLTRNLDLFPTLLELADAPIPRQLDGTSLVTAASDVTETPDERSYVETYLSATWLFADPAPETPEGRVGMRRIGVRTPRWKYVINDPVPFLDRESIPVSPDVRRAYYSEHLYDLAADPGENTNVIAREPEVAATLRRFVLEEQQVTQTDSVNMALDEQTRDRLRALGYLAD